MTRSGFHAGFAVATVLLGAMPPAGHAADAAFGAVEEHWQVRADAENWRLPGDESMGAVRLALRHRLGDWFAAGIDGSAAVRGSRGGFITLGVGAEAALGRPLEELLSIEAVLTLRAAPERIKLSGADGRRLHASVRRQGGALLVELEPDSLAGAEEDGGFSQGWAAAAGTTLAADLEATANLYDIARAAVDTVSEITRFDRTLITRFLPDGSGEVIAEVKRSTATAFLGLRFPASDLPPAERAAALLCPLRVVVDTQADPVPLLPALNPRTGRAADLSQAILRPPPKARLEALRARGVVTAIRAALIVEGKLWGVLACHHETPRLVEPALRAALAGIADQTAAALARVVEAERVEAERQVARRLAAVEAAVLHSDNTVRQLLASDPGLLDLAAADGLAVVAGEGVVCFGLAPDLALIRRHHLAQKSPPYRPGSGCRRAGSGFRRRCARRGRFRR